MQPIVLARRTLLALLLTTLVLPARAGQEDHSVRTLTGAYNASGQALFRDLARASGNLVLSPYSIGAVMAMARSGARAETEREMAIALHHRQSREQIDEANSALIAILNGYDRTSRPGYCPRGTRWTGARCEGPVAAGGKCGFLMRDGEVCIGDPVLPSAKLLTANALMLSQRGGLISSQYQVTVRDKYAAEIHADADADRVNAWVKGKTEGKIDRILDRLDPQTAAVLINAVYFKAAWGAPFDKSETRHDDFNLSTAQKVRVPMMRQEGGYALVERPGYRAIRLDYAPAGLAMIVALPNEISGLAEIARVLDAGELEDLRAALKHDRGKLVALALPRFRTAYKTDALVEALHKAGMRLAFTDHADFGGMTGRPPADGGVKIGQITHHALIEVTEQGTEAAAATAAMVVANSAGPPRERPQPIPFAVDRPFLFYVVDDASSAVLFQGRIVDPRNE
jgi:leukocyte elastase inhibitor